MASTSSAILMISCPDRKGLVARITDFIYRHNGNILHADHHIDEEAGLFLMRVEWDLSDFTVDRGEIRSAFALLARELGLNWELRFSDEIPKSAIFVSRHDHCLYDLLLRHGEGEFRADLSLVISNHPDLRAVTESFGIEYLVFPITREIKVAQEARILGELAKRDIEFIVLARYMQPLRYGRAR